MSWRGFGKRVKSPTSVTSTTALISAMPRIACRASTTGRKDSVGQEAKYLFLDPFQEAVRHPRTAST